MPNSVCRWKKTSFWGNTFIRSNLITGGPGESYHKENLFIYWLIHFKGASHRLIRITPNQGQRQKKLPRDVSRVEDIVDARRVIFHVKVFFRVGVGRDRRVPGVGKRETSNLGVPWSRCVFFEIFQRSNNGVVQDPDLYSGLLRTLLTGFSSPVHSPDAMR